MLLLPNTGVNKPSGVVNFKGNKYKLEILLFYRALSLLQLQYKNVFPENATISNEAFF